MLRRKSRPTRQRQLKAGKDDAAALLTKLNAMEQRNAELEAMLAKEKRADDELEQQARWRTAEVSDDMQRVREAFARLSESPGSSVIIEHRSRHKNGSWRWIEAVSANLLAEHEVRAIVCNFRDITKRRQAAEALRESEERFRVALKTSPAVVFNQDRDLRYT
jgi:PAS domain-containing protein